MLMISEVPAFLLLSTGQLSMKTHPVMTMKIHLPFLNVGTGTDLSIYELAYQVANAVGYEGSIFWDTNKPDGTPKKQLDVSRLAAMGWRAKICLREGLKNTVRDFEQSIERRGMS